MNDSTLTDAVLARAFARFDPVALGVAGGAVTGLLLFAATAVLLLKGGAEVGPTLTLLNQYFPGYSVTWPGALVGLGYGAGMGFVVGWVGAVAHNVSTAVYLYVVHFRANLHTVTDTIDPDHSL
jgi:hypothetical protein